MIKQFKIDLLSFVQEQYDKEEDKKPEIVQLVATCLDYLKGQCDILAINKPYEVVWVMRGLSFADIEAARVATDLAYKGANVETWFVRYSKELKVFFETYNQKEELTDDKKKELVILDKFLKVESDLSFLAEGPKGVLYKVLIPIVEFENFFEVENLEIDIEVDYQTPAQHIFDGWIDDPKSCDIEITLLTQHK
jgi:hypothetical protein